MIAIGEYIKKVLKEKGISVTEFGKRINTHRRNIYDIFERKSIDTGLLQKISEVLEHNFFQYYIPDKSEIVKEPSGKYYNSQDITKLINKLKKYENRVNMLEKENQTLLERIRDKEIIIELMQKKS